MITKSANVRYLRYVLGKVFIGGLISLALLVSGCGSVDGGVEIQPSSTPQSSPTYTSLPTKTLTPSPTETLIPPTPTPGIGSTVISDKDGMTLLYVPAGKFTMGANHKLVPNEYSSSYTDSYPQHSVTLDSFWIDRTEVTNKQYAMCVSDGDCALPFDLKSPMRSSYYGDPQFGNYPVVYMEWSMAGSYCKWAGRRMPTEAEWEKAAAWDGWPDLSLGQ